MAIVAGLLVQNALKLLLHFGSVTPFLGYDALNDYFPSYRMKANPDCEESFCRKRQKEYASTKKEETKQLPQEASLVVEHEDNDWDIQVVDESQDVLEDKSSVAPGLRLAYQASGSSVPSDTESSTQDLDTLMAKLKGLSS